MMIKKARTESTPEPEPQYSRRGSRKFGVGLSTYQKTIMREKREALGISQKALGEKTAELAGLKEPISQAMISYLEKVNPRGVRKPALASEFLPIIETILRLPKGSLVPGKHPVAASLSVSTQEPALLPI